MQGGTAEFEELVNHSHVSGFKIDITDSAGVIQASTEDGNIVCMSGRVTIDRQATTRRSGSLQFSDIDGNTVPKTLSVITSRELFNPLSFFEFRPYRGLQLSSGDMEWKPQGVFTISDLGVKQRGEELTLDVTMHDRSMLVSDNKWTAPYNISKNTNYATAIQGIITNRAKGFTPTFNFEETSSVTPPMSFGPSDDPWEAAEKLAEAIGMELFFDEQGVLVLRTIPDPAIMPVSKYLKEDENGVVVGEIDRTLNKREARSGVIVRGSAPWMIYPVSASVWDEDPLSATYRYGPMGEVPEQIEDAAVTNSTMALTAATAKFNKIVGVLEDISFGMLVDPRLDASDIIEIDQPRAGVSGKFVIDSLEMPLEPEQTLTGKSRRRRRQ
jgi:hypothetical protein